MGIFINPNAIQDNSMAKDKLNTSLQTEIDNKQEALTLTIKDNGNIVLANIQGQSKEFMPATPSGDPMHYAYVAAGAEYNDTGADIIKTTPWADMADDDADKTVVHKAGYWYLNGLGDITNDEIRDSYNKSIGFLDQLDISEFLRYVNLRTNFSKYIIKGGYSNITMNLAFSNSDIEVITFTKNVNAVYKYNITQCVLFANQSKNLRHILGRMAVDNITDVKRITGFLQNCTKLNTINLMGLKIDIDLHTCGALSVKSALYMINNETATSPITITLHADVYNKCMANADILSALEQHPNVSLASA